MIRKVNVVKNDSETVIEVSGRVDATTAPELDTEVNKNIEGVKKLIFDFKDMEYISSAGLRVILSAQKKMNEQGEMLVKNVSDDVKEVFEITGFLDFLKFA